jgi:hypothetical protein
MTELKKSLISQFCIIPKNPGHVKNEQYYWLGCYITLGWKGLSWAKTQDYWAQ